MSSHYGNDATCHLHSVALEENDPTSKLTVENVPSAENIVFHVVFPISELICVQLGGKKGSITTLPGEGAVESTLSLFSQLSITPSRRRLIHYIVSKKDQYTKKMTVYASEQKL